MNDPAKLKTRRNASVQRAATIADVAALAGCSPMTVSRVINADGNVRPALRDRVRAAVDTLNYSPNRAARSLAGVGEVRLGMLYTNPSAAYLSEFLVGALDEASRSGAHLMVEKCEDWQSDRKVIDQLIATGIDGVLLPPPLCDDDALLRYFGEQNVQVVAVGAGQPHPGTSTVRIDERRAAADMTDHILGLGHERIGFIIGNPEQAASGERLLGYRDALRKSGTQNDRALEQQGFFTYQSGLIAAENLLDLAVPPTAIFASNDDMAAAVVAVAHRRHLHVPDDLTVCGFDDTALAVTIWPELTTIHQPVADMTRDAIRLLLSQVNARRLDRPFSPQDRTLDHRLVIRASAGPPAKVSE